MTGRSSPARRKHARRRGTRAEKRTFLIYCEGLRDECLNIEDFANLLEARVVIEDWHHDYNHYRPHRSLKGQTLAAYAANHQPTQPTITTNQHP